MATPNEVMVKQAYVDTLRKYALPVKEEWLDLMWKHQLDPFELESRVRALGIIIRSYPWADADTPEARALRRAVFGKPSWRWRFRRPIRRLLGLRPWNAWRTRESQYLKRRG